jgi:hypothetical protein
MKDCSLRDIRLTNFSLSSLEPTYFGFQAFDIHEVTKLDIVCRFAVSTNGLHIDCISVAKWHA